MSSPARKYSQAAFRNAVRKHVSKSASGDVPGADSIREGLEISTLDEIRERLGLSEELLERTLHVSTRTLQRRRKVADRLSPAESDRLWRILHVFKLALEAFDYHEEAARTWLTTPKAILRGEAPIERLDTGPGLREVEDMLAVIDETSAA